MIRIDAHTHVFQRVAGFARRGELCAIGNGKARWANGEEIQLIPEGVGDKSFQADTLVKLLRENGMDKAVLLQGSFYGFDNHYVWQAAQQYPDVFVPAATFDPFCQQAGELLDYCLNKLNFRVFKFETSSGGGLMGYHRDFAIDGPVFEEIFAKIAASGSVLVLDIGSPGMASFQPRAVASVARRYPQMHIILCHLLAPTPGDEAPLEKALEELSLENIWLDLAAMPWNVYPEAYPYPTAQKFLSIAKDTVGSARLLWGSDVPSTLTRESYKGQMQWVEESGLFSAGELEGVMGGNAMAAYML